MSYDEAAKLPGEEIVGDLIERCILWSDIIMERSVSIFFCAYYMRN